MNLKEAMKRIEALEAEVARLKAQPRQEYHYYYPPMQPSPQPLWPLGPTWTCGAGPQG